MRITHRRFAGVGAAALLLTAAACGAGNSSTTAPPAADASGSSTAGSGSAAPVASGGGNASGTTINVLMVNNPQMTDLQALTAENFTKETGITVNYTVLPENDMRDKASQEFSNQAGQYDVATLSNFEIPFYSTNGWLTALSDIPAYKDDAQFKQDDIFPSMTNSLKGKDGKIYGEPFYGESSFLMYRKDIFKKKGITLKDTPTWDEVAAAAEKADGAESGMKGICLRGQAGWGQLGAPLTTMVNTFGGTWFDKDWNAQVNSAEFKMATDFYVKLVKEHGEVGAAQAGFTECLTAMQQSKVAMWYDATSAAGSLEAKDSPVAGKIGYVQAPVNKTKSSGWLYAWSWAIEAKSPKADAAWKFVSWASSQKYEELVGQKLGWAKVPAGKRQSLYKNAEYTKAAEAFAPATLAALQAADPTNPGMQQRPTVGIQFVDIPEFTDLGTKVTSLLSGVIAGNGTVDDALKQGQALAKPIGESYK